MNNNTSHTPPALTLSLAAAIAAALPGKWTAKAISEGGTWSNYYLTRADGLQIFLAGSQGGWAAKGRLLVQHSRPRQNGKHVDLWENGAQIDSPEITAAETKSPEKIAGDIAARLLPEAERIDALAVASISRENRGEAARVETLRAIGAATGETVANHYGEPHFSVYHRGVSLTVNTGESVRVELTATRAQALALLAFLDSPAYRGAE